MNSTHFLPHNFLAEKMVLSSILVNPESMSIVIKQLSIECFYFKNHQEIFKVLIYMYQKNQSIDILNLTTFLQEYGLLQKVGGIKVLIEIVNQLPNLPYIEKHISLIKDKFLRRTLIKLGYKLINSSYITNISLETLLFDFEQQFFNLTSTFAPSKLTNTTELISEIFVELKQKVKYPNLPGLCTGFYSLDSLTQGFHKSDLIIIAGRPSIGKTAFSLTLALNICKLLKVPIVFFSLEMSKEQLFYRLLSMETNINQVRLRNGKLTKSDWIKLNKVVKLFSNLPFFINDCSNISIQDLQTNIKSLILERNQISLVIIDYLQLIQFKVEKSENRAQELSQITRSLKNTAREFNIPIIALSQLSRNVENRPDKKPILSDLRESGSIEQDADLILMLSQNQDSFGDSNSKIDLTIAKQRNGPTGTIQLQFDKKLTKYLDFQ
uniref:Replicative DNA helicase n=1 Tax=Licmophora sp. TaxID=2115823 RepID=A0A2U9NNI0_9STRA|nr:DNA replication helicase [Licmophora sp.]